MNRRTLAALGVAATLSLPLISSPAALAATPEPTPAASTKINDHSVMIHEFAPPLQGSCHAPLDWATTGNTAGTVFDATAPDGKGSVRCSITRVSRSASSAFDAAIAGAKTDGWSVTVVSRDAERLAFTATRGGLTQRTELVVKLGRQVTAVAQWAADAPSTYALLGALIRPQVYDEIELLPVSWRPSAAATSTLPPSGLYNGYNGRFNYWCELPNGWRASADYNARSLSAERDSETSAMCTAMWLSSTTREQDFDRVISEVMKPNGWTITSDERSGDKQVLTATKGAQTAVRVSKRFDDRLLTAHWEFRTAEKDAFLPFLKTGYLIEGAEGPRSAGTPSATPGAPKPSATPTTKPSGHPGRGVEARTGAEDEGLPLMPLAAGLAGLTGAVVLGRRRS